MIHCKKCKAVNPEKVTACRNCGADLLAQFAKPDPRRNILIIGAGISVLLFGGVALLNRLLAGEWRWECAIVTVITVVLGCGIAAIAMKGSVNYQSDPHFKRALYHKDLDPQQAIADFRQVLETRPETQTSPAARLVIYRELADLYAGLGLQEDLDAAVRVVVDSYNEEIEKPKFTSGIGMSMKAREDFCGKHHVPSRLSNRQPTGTCAACGRHLEGQRYHFYYGKLVKTSATPLILPGVAVGGSRSATWQIKGREDAHLCYICFPIPDEERGARKAIEAKKELLQMQGYDSFFTPAEYKSLSTR